MPYDIKKRPDGYHVFNQMTGEDKGKSTTRAKAEAHMRALYANEPGKGMSSPGMMAKGGTVPSALDDTYTARPITHVFAGGKRYLAGGIVEPEDEKGEGIGEPVNEKHPEGAGQESDDHNMGTFKKGGVLSRIAKKTKKGGLHESLGIPQDQKIPEERIAAAAKKPGLVGQQARLAETYAKFRK